MTNTKEFEFISNEEKCFSCAWCNRPVPTEDCVWIDPSTGKATTGDTSAPFHVQCAPNEYP